MVLVYRYRVKSLTGLLNTQSRAVNFVWNYCNDRQKDALRFGKRWLTGFDLNKLTSGSSKELGVHSGTINAVCEQYAKSRSQKKRPFLRYRSRNKSLGWVPFKGRDLKCEGDAFRFAGRTFRVFNSRALPEGKTHRRNDFHHQLAARIVREFDVIAVGNVNAAGLAQTGMAKSVLDAGWSSFRSMLKYKSMATGAWYEEVDERFTTQTCSSCGALPDSRPKGIAGLGIREWQCSGCGCVHDRDRNAALNILRRGRATLAVGIPAF